MAVWTCGKCGNDNDVAARFCGSCGTERARVGSASNGRTILKIAGVIIVLGLLLRMCAPDRPNPADDVASTPSAAVAPADASSVETPAPQPAPAIGAQWIYQADADPMTSKVTYLAGTRSVNQVEFDFPYRGLQNGMLMLRNHPSYGRGIVFSIERGQILCRSYEDCTVRVRFDEEAPRDWNAVGPADNSSDTIFLRNYEGFLKRLQSAKRVRIAVPIYKQGEPVFEFDVSGFDVAQYKPSNKDEK